MKKVFFAIIIVLAIASVATSCERKSGRRTSPVRTEIKDTIWVTPEKIGVTDLTKKFIPFPDYDGGTGIEVSFLIGVQSAGKVYEVKYFESVFFRGEKTIEESWNTKEVVNTLSNYQDFCLVGCQNFKVALLKGEIVKIKTISRFIGNEFFPEKTIWQRKF